MYNVFKWHGRKQESGGEKMELGQPSPMGRYPSTHSQVRALLEHVDIAGDVLDCCGGTNDAVCAVLTERGFRVATNDFDARLVADSHMDATTDGFVEAFGEGARRPEWVVTSPPYKHAFAILKHALRVGRVGVAFKLRLTFLEPTKTRGQWLKDNPPHSIVVLPRAIYRGRTCSSTEAWFIWRGGQVDGASNKPGFFFALPA